MESKRLVTLFTFIGGTIGSYIPMLWGANSFSFSSLFFGAVGAILGIFIAFRLTH